MVLGFDIQNFDRDRPGGLKTLGSWAGLHLANQHNPSEWGHLILKGRPVPAWSFAIGALLLVMALGGALWKTGARSDNDRERSDDKEKPGQEKTPEGFLVGRMKGLTQQRFADAEFNLDTLSRELKRNANYLSGLFRRTTGERFVVYLTNLRLAHADKLLRETEKNITAIALESGFSSPDYFARTYKKAFGTTPSTAREGRPRI